MRIKVRNVKKSGVPVRFGPKSEPIKFKVDLLEEARKRLSIGFKEFDDLELEIGDRLDEKPYPKTDRATMPPTYLCGGSVWVNFYSPDGSCANVSLVPHLHKTVPPHHNFWLYWTDFDGSKYSEDHIPGHFIDTDEPVVVKIICGAEIRKGTLGIKSRKSEP